MKRVEIESAVREVVGAPWVHQGRDIVAGIDCLGVLLYVAEKVNIDVTDYTTYSRRPDGVTLLAEMRKYFDEIPVDSAREGDILIFRMAGEKYPSHVGILTRGLHEYTLVHSITTNLGGKTVEETLRRWARFRTNAFRFRGLED